MQAPGLKTKAFWLTAGGLVLATLVALGYGPEATDGTIGKGVALGGSLLAALGYTGWRGSVKAGQPGKPAWKQTEFWLSIVAVVVSLAAASGAFEMDSTAGKVIAFLGATLATLGYGKAQAKSAGAE